MDQKGFDTATKINHFNVAQAWHETPPVSSRVIDPYEDGTEAIGNNRRKRIVVKELDYIENDDKKKARGFLTCTNN